jgi:hypothetical protein
MKFFWLATAVAASFAVVVLLGTLATSTGAPQQAAGAAVAVAVAVIPYVFTRAIEGWQTSTWRQAMLDETKKAKAES